jgi:HAD superfamily phosphatase (TIGR01668 family)
MGFFVPDFYYDTIYDITPELLLSRKIRGIILDIDNTLVPYEIPEPTEEVRAWLLSMTDAGIKIAFVSNNHAERVELFNKSLGHPAFPDSGKPLRKSCLKAFEALECKAENVAIIGDQVFTDVLAGKIAKVNTTILVKPIKDKKNLFFRFKRLLEKPVIYTYNRRNKKKGR